MASGNLVLRNNATGSPDYAGAGAPSLAIPASTVTYNGKSTNAPASSVILRNADGTPNYSSSGTLTGSGVLNANISNPANGNVKVPAPVVVTSDAAAKDLATKKAAVDQLNADTAAHNTSTSTPQGTPETTKSDTTTSSTTQTPPTLDDQVDSLLNGLNTGETKVDTDAQSQTSSIQSELDKTQNEIDTQATSALTQLKTIASGTYPLSPAEQNLLSSTASVFQSTIAAQTTANQATVGQMTELMASLGISTSAPTQAIGLISSTIASGASAIATLNANMATSLAQLSLGFQKEDYAEVSDAWDKTSQYLEDRTKTLQDMQTSVLDAAKQQKQDMKDFVELSLNTIVTSAKFTYQQKQDAIDNAFKQQTINETTRHNLATEAASGSGGGTFTTAQINTGAANAGVPVETFKGWDADTKNLFINGDVKGTKKTIDDALATGSVDDVKAAIKDMKLPAQAETYFTSYAEGQDTGETGIEKRAQTFADTFTDLQKQGYDRNEALDEVLNEWSDSGKSTVTKTDNKMIKDALSQVYGIQTFGIPDVQYNDGKGFTRFKE